MKLKIDDFCIRCGICIDLYPNLYKRNYEEDCIDILMDEIPEDMKEQALGSIRDCAVTAIRIDK